jgi:hypothetical protein
MTSLMNQTVISQEPTFEREGLVVQQLATKSGPAKKFYLSHAQTWLDAFCLFRELENKIGLPETADGAKNYFVILSVLIASGEYLLSKLSDKDKLLHDYVGVSLDGLKGCLELLKDSANHFSRQFSPEDIKEISDRIFDGEVAA